MVVTIAPVSVAHLTDRMELQIFKSQPYECLILQGHWPQKKVPCCNTVLVKFARVSSMEHGFGK